MKRLHINMVSESDISVQGHGVHTAYIEMAAALERRDDILVTRGEFGRRVDCDVVHIHTIGFSALRKLFQPNVKKVISAHIIPASLVGSIRGAKYWMFVMRPYMRWFYGRADKVLAVSDSVAKSLRDELGVAEDKIETLHNTIDMTRYANSPAQRAEARRILSISQDAFLVIGNGQVQPRKRLDTFVAMAEAHPDVQFIWIGGVPFKQLGANYSRMKQLMNATPSNMIITGVIPHQEVRRYLHAGDVFCLPAEQENHPMCVLEAAGASLPIILRDIPEYDDTFKQDVLRCADNQAFVDAVTSLHDNASLRDTYIKKAQKIANRFDSDAAAAWLVKLYRSLTGIS